MKVIDPYFIVNMRPGRLPGRAKKTNYLTPANHITRFDVVYLIMTIKSGKSVVMFDQDRIAKFSVPA